MLFCWVWFLFLKHTSGNRKCVWYCFDDIWPSLAAVWNHRNHVFILCCDLDKGTFLNQSIVHDMTFGRCTCDRRHVSEIIIVRNNTYDEKGNNISSFVIYIQAIVTLGGNWWLPVSMLFLFVNKNTLIYMEHKMYYLNFKFPTTSCARNTDFKHSVALSGKTCIIKTKHGSTFGFSVNWVHLYIRRASHD